MALAAIALFGIITFLVYLEIIFKSYFKRKQLKKLRREVDQILPPKTIEELRRIYEEHKNGL